MIPHSYATTQKTASQNLQPIQNCCHAMDSLKTKRRELTSRTVGRTNLDARYIISKLARLRPPNSLDHTLKARMILALKCIFKLAWSPYRSASLSLLDYGLRVYVQICSITASKFARLQPPSASPHLLDHGLQVHIQTRSITTSKCISKLARSWPPSASPNLLNHSLQVHL